MMLKIDPRVRAEVSVSFDSPALTPADWDRLLLRGETDAVNLTWHWQRSWWSAFGRGHLLLVSARRSRELIAAAPLFADGGMVFNLCPEDMLDFAGDTSDPAVLDALLSAAREHVENFVGFRFYFIPDTSLTGERLQQAATRLGLRCFAEDRLPSPWLDLAGQPEFAQACARKRSLLRHERYFCREGDLQVDHLLDAAEVLPHLDDFFRQHIARRAATPHPSLFLDEHQREYYRDLARVAASQDWLRFTRVLWNGRAIAYHFGLSYRGRYLWGIPSFEIELARLSPGEVLLRHVLLHAIAEGADRFDFGPGDEPYKSRFSTHVTYLQNWGLYPSETDGRAPCSVSW